MVAFKSLSAIAALSFVNTAQAWYNDLPSCLAPFEPFVYSGCYDNGQPGQKEALSLRSDLDQNNMTVETCVAHCKGNNYRLAGLSYYGVCYCGQTVSTALLPEEQCSFPCSGDSSETCGGDTEINIYMDPTFKCLEEQNDISEYSPVGCWTDESSQGKALFYRQDNLDSKTLTTEKCLKSCLKGGFPFAGTEYGGECYCGVVIGNGTSLATDPSTCNVPCNGNKGETCGGPGRLSLYVATDLQSLEPCGDDSPPDSSSSSSSSSSVATTTTTTAVTTTPVVTYPATTTTTTPAITTTTTRPVTTTTTTTTAPVCTSTSVIPSTCEYKVGRWCSNPLPDWTDKKGCLAAYASCAIQSASCFLKAGFPEALRCFEYKEWCIKQNKYCYSGGSCNKSDWHHQSPPKGGDYPTTQTTTYPCPTTVTTKTTTKATTTTPAPTASCPVAYPTGICQQPSNRWYGYGPGNPVGGIELPAVTCNNIKNDYYAGNVFKLYTEKDSHKCRSYTRPKCSNACSDACKAQFQQCESVYTEGCKAGRFNRHWNDADKACKAQYKDCLGVNKWVKDTGCNTWYDGCASTGY
ncbi:WSC domain-containing protein [Astrocystis sublimbata]|nr:WSC domain-containing protein [Astrocystis sublimbata]